MSDTIFFDDWTKRTITFTTPTQSAWRLEHKLAEKNDQPTAHAYNVDEIGRGRAGGAYGTFQCRNTESNEEAIVKIMVQVPYKGSEYTVKEERERQASQILTRNAVSETRPLMVLTLNKCTAAPMVKAYRQTMQDEDSKLVPGGFLHYLLMTKVPGQQLSSDLFWGFDRQVRDQIRNAFRVAWEECLRAGIKPCPWGLKHLFWNPASQKIYIAGFRYAPAATPEDHWSDNDWIAWGLARCPANFSSWQTSTEPHPNMSCWTL